MFKIITLFKFSTHLDSKRCIIDQSYPCFFYFNDFLNLQTLWGYATLYKLLGNKVHGANMGPTWVLSAPDGPHVGPMNLAVRVVSTDWCNVTGSLFNVGLATWSHNSTRLGLLVRWLGVKWCTKIETETIKAFDINDVQSIEGLYCWWVGYSSTDRYYSFAHSCKQLIH